MKFAEEIAEIVRDYMFDPEFIARFKRGTFGKTLYVIPSTDANYVDFVKTHQPYADGTPAVYTTITDAVAALKSGWEVLVAPGGYDEALITIPHSINNIRIESLGGRGSAYIEPSVEDQGGMVVHADDVTLVNIGVAAEDDTSASAIIVTGARFRAYGSKFEGGANQLVIGPGTDAQITAGTRGDGADALLVDCEFAWGTNGIVLQCSDYGAVTQTRIERCRFHNLSTSHIKEVVLAGGTASIAFRNLQVVDSVFDDSEGGTAPTAYIILNGDNGNDGIVTGCRFPTAINGGLNLVSTALHWIGNYHTGGISAAQPS